MYDFSNWNKVTSELGWGVQRAFHDALSAVAENGTKMAYGADVSNGFPCLVNTVQPMLATSYGPMKNYGSVVREFDSINAYFERCGVNEGVFVSPLAADFMIRNFGDLKEAPTAEMIAEALMEKQPMIYQPEVSDEEFMQHLITMGTAPNVDEDTSIDVGEAQRLADRIFGD